MTLLDVEADAVLLCNVLDQVPLDERRSVLEGAFHLVRRGGAVGASTLFYDGGVPPVTRPFYLRWMAETRSSLARASVSWVVPGQTPVALQRLTPGQHHDLIASLGYDEIKIAEVPFDWRLEDWEALCRYSVFIQGALWPEIDLATGSQALIEGVRAAYRALGLEPFAATGSTARRAGLGTRHLCQLPGPAWAALHQQTLKYRQDDPRDVGQHVDGQESVGHRVQSGISMNQTAVFTAA